MNKLLICTQWKIWRGTSWFVEMIAGKLNNTIAISLLPTMSIDDYIEKIRDNLERKTIIFVLLICLVVHLVIL